MEGEHTHKAEKSSGLLPNRPQPPSAASMAPVYSPHRLQQMVGNRAAGRVIQAEFNIGSARDRYEQEADSVADQVMRGEGRADRSPGLLARTGSQRIQRMCSECGEGALRPSDDDETDHLQLKAEGGADRGITPLIQRKARDSPEAEDTSAGPAPSESSSRSLLVGDETSQLEPGQMRKTEFLGRLREVVCSEAEQAMSGTGQTTEGCPYVEQWFGYYQDKDSRYIERSLHKYAPEAAGVNNANEYIPIVASRVRRSVETWAKTGELTGVPEDLAAQVAVGGALGAIGGVFGAIGGVISGIASAVGSVVSGIGSAISKIGGFLFKARDGGARPIAEPRSHQLGLSGGRGLESSVRNRMEPAFGYDFSQVRIHTDPEAADASLQMNARAFTVGSQIAFAPGEYQPGTLIGDALIAHELAHVVQQGGAVSAGGVLQKGEAPGESLEEDADIAAVRAVAGVWGGPRGLARATQNAMPALKSGLRLQRCVHKDQPPAVAAPPRPPPANVAAGACVQPFSTVTFSLSNQTGSGEPNSMEPRKLPLPAQLGGGWGVGLFGIRPVHYNPQVTINAPDDATAANFEAGLIQNVLTSDRTFTYSGGALIRDVTSPLPIKDGAPPRSGGFDKVFASIGQGVLEDFEPANRTVALHVRDTPQDGVAMNRPDDFDPARHDRTCPAGTPPATLERLRMQDSFRTWIGVRRKDTDCVVTQHHIDWRTNWEATVVPDPGGAAPTVTPVSQSIEVTEANGDGSPPFVQGAPVAGDAKQKRCGD
jgi:hypothetical protein